MGTEPPSQKGGRAPHRFLAHFYCGQTAGCITMPLGMQVGLSPGHFVFDGDPATLPPNFRPMSIVAKRPDGSRWHLALKWALVQATLCWGTSSPPPKRGQRPPIFGPFLLSPIGWMNQDGTWHGGGPWSKPHCARLGPSFPPSKRDSDMEIGLCPGDFVLDGQPPSHRGGAPNFRLTSIVAKRLHASRCHLVRR